MWQRREVAIGSDKASIFLEISGMREAGYPEGTKKFYPSSCGGAFI